MARVLCIWLPNWPIQRLRASARDELRDRPLVLFARHPQRGQRVTAACPEALRRGVRIGMPASEVAALLAGRPIEPRDLHVAAQNSAPRAARPQSNSQPTETAPFTLLQHDRDADDAAISLLALECTEHFSPIVATESLDPKPWAGRYRHQSESLLLDITSLDRLLGGDSCIGRRIVRHFRRQGLYVRVAIASTVGTAIAVARYGPTARVPVVVPAGGESQWIAPLPPAALRIDEECQNRLHRLGIDSIGALLTLPRAGLATRLGDRLLLRLDQALGRTAEPLETIHTPIDTSASTDLEYPTKDVEILLHAFSQLILALTTRLAERNWGIVRVVCRLSGPAMDPIEVTINLYAASDDAPHLLRLVQHRLEQVRLKRPVERLHAAALLVGPLSQRQLECFDDEAARRDPGGRHFARLLDTLSGRMGRKTVLGVRPVEEPKPELAYELFPLTGRTSVPAAHSAAKKPHRPAAGWRRASSQVPPESFDATARDILRRPLQLLTPPRQLEVLAVVPEGPPLRCIIAGEQHQVARYWGPERIETGWWQGQSIRRDYYRIETTTGLWFWIYRERNHQTWFLHGQW